MSGLLTCCSSSFIYYISSDSSGHVTAGKECFTLSLFLFRAMGSSCSGWNGGVMSSPGEHASDSSHLQSSNFSWVILLYFHFIVLLESLLRLLKWCLWAVLLGLFFIETLSSVSKIYHLYSLFFVSSNLCDFVYLFRWSFMILFFLNIFVLHCVHIS